MEQSWMVQVIATGTDSGAAIPGLRGDGRLGNPLHLGYKD